MHDAAEQAKELTRMIGQTVVNVAEAKNGSNVLILAMDDGTIYAFNQAEDFSKVEIADVCGDTADLIGSPLIQAEKVSSKDARPYDPFTGAQCNTESDDSLTWTFYKFATNKGSLTIRWLGLSNGYYSEDVDLTVLRPDN